MQIQPKIFRSLRPGSPPQSDQAEDSPGDLLDKFHSRFDDWDLNNNGQIAWSEIRKNVANPDIKGEEAVELASLYSLIQHDVYYRGLQQTPPVKFNGLYDLYYEYYGPEAEKPIADLYYGKYKLKLGNTANELFPQGLPNAFNIRQGAAPSCGFLATTFAQTQTDPFAVKESIQETKEGRLQVTFPGVKQTVTVEKPTDSEKALFATAEENGTWLTALEKAWGVHQKRENPLAAFEQTTYPEDAIAAWTNGKATTRRVPKDPKGYQKGELPHFLRTTHRELASNHLAVAWTRYDGIRGEDFVPGHAYTVTGIDYEDGTISLRNPWGHLEPKNENGEALDGRDDGAFEYPLAKFHTKFEKIARQTD